MASLMTACRIPPGVLRRRRHGQRWRPPHGRAERLCRLFESGAQLPAGSQVQPAGRKGSRTVMWLLLREGEEGVGGEGGGGWRGGGGGGGGGGGRGGGAGGSG